MAIAKFGMILERRIESSLKRIILLPYTTEWIIIKSTNKINRGAGQIKAANRCVGLCETRELPGDALDQHEI